MRRGRVSCCSGRGVVMQQGLQPRRRSAEAAVARPLDLRVARTSSLAGGRSRERCRVNVSELARSVGIRSSAIRFYESRGVLPAPERRANGYRDYDEADFCRLRVFVTLRSLGIELRESGRLAQLCAAGECDEMEEQLLPRLQQRRAEIEVARAELDHLDAELALLERKMRRGEPNELRFIDGTGKEEPCALSQC